MSPDAVTFDTMVELAATAGVTGVPIVTPDRAVLAFRTVVRLTMAPSLFEPMPRTRLSVIETAPKVGVVSHADVPDPLPTRTAVAVGGVAPVPSLVSRATIAVSLTPWTLLWILLAVPSPSSCMLARVDAAG